ncbi:MAG: alkaline phosphatase [Candidatus Pristimantibacillus lignocellulolyticus]|uniref:Alkaline phosphatase n=1 Tax=Candidatus Pristimantibacillus lignocellulolyticus TaxID=2994561 RepID=A0A9J6ZF73_9BACL|nr:MAG: alkaline phosphatase [Candidatus Pristimantibacillus lignocellulolyticus]
MKKKVIKAVLASCLVFSTLSIHPVLAVDNQTSASAKSKNLIVLIGDGMGPAQVSAARNYLMYNKNINHLTLDSIYVGQATTYADRGEDGGTIVSGVVTDSASAGTAFATGNKTYNAGISVSNEDVSKPFASIIEAAEVAGKATGLVTTARITHATPAVYASHVRSRDNESAIASQYLESGVDVLFGGGSSFFLSKADGGKRTDKSIITDFEAKGYSYIDNASELQSLTATSGKALGLFSSSHIPYVLDRTAEIPTLAQMTTKALSILEQDEDGFTIMIEGGRIDHASHANDFPSTVQEVLDFDAAVKVALDYAKKDGNTSVVITADHETGGLSLSRDNIYEMNLDLWDKQVHSSEYMVSKLNAAVTIDDIKKIVKANTWITDLTDEEAKIILAGDGSSYGREGGYNQVISKRLLVGWSGHGHSAVDVGVWAYGPIVEQVSGQIDNTQIAKASAQIIEVDLTTTSATMQAKYLYPKFKITRDNEVLYPAKALAEALGAKVEWNAAAHLITITSGANVMKVETNKLEVNLNGTNTGLRGHLDNGKLYLSLASFNKLTGKNMTWDSLSERIVK